MAMNLREPQETVEDRGPWHAAVHGVTKSWAQLSDWTTTTPEFRDWPLNIKTYVFHQTYFKTVLLRWPWDFCLKHPDSWAFVLTDLSCIYTLYHVGSPSMSLGTGALPEYHSLEMSHRWRVYSINLASYLCWANRPVTAAVNMKGHLILPKSRQKTFYKQNILSVDSGPGYSTFQIIEWDNRI